MKLMYDIPEADRAAYDAAAEPDEKLMYVVPFNVWEDRFVKGWTAVTDRRIFCMLDGKILSSYELEKCTVNRLASLVIGWDVKAYELVVLV